MPTLTLPDGGRIEATEELVVGDDLRMGPDVLVRCRRLRAGRGVRIGCSDDANAFRHPGGVRITVDEAILDPEVRIEREVLIEGGRIHLGHGVQLHAQVTVRAVRQLVLGPWGTVHSHCELSGVDMVIGRELWMLPFAKVGGGSAFDVHSSLRIGDWCHLGIRSFVNTAREVILGHEVGLGTGTSLYTHGAYPSALDGKPVAFGPIRIGDRAWLPGAVVNPSVTIGSDCVIGVGSVVTRDLPAGCLAGGTPARILKEGAYPRLLDGTARRDFLVEFLRTFGEVLAGQLGGSVEPRNGGLEVAVAAHRVAWYPDLPPDRPSDWPNDGHAAVLADGASHEAWPETTIVHLNARTVTGPVTPLSERLLNQLRRYGIRFRVEPRDGWYVPWT